MSVPGTPQAQAAVIQAQIPQRAAVKRKTATPKVTYQGEPTFKPIPGTSVSYAVNSAFDVLKIDDAYFVCEKAAWFKSDNPLGPWELTDEIPDEVESIPAPSPVHHVTYVDVYESNSNAIVYGYTAGYMGI